MTSAFAFRPCHRLRLAADFKRVYQRGRRLGDDLFGLSTLPNELGFARLGMAVSTRSVGNSVRRNRVRRIIREVFRVQRPALPPLDFVITSRAAARAAVRPQIVDSLERLFGQAARKAAASGTRRDS